nr:MAG: nucleocapsid [Xinjiang sediment orthophasma-like virus]
MIDFTVDKALLTGHTVEQSYLISGIQPSALLSTAGQQIDLEKLTQEFHDQICDDFTDEITLQQPSKALGFAHKMIYEVGPSSRGKKDKAWTFQFPSKTAATPKNCTVMTLKTANPTLSAKTGLLTVKRATLLCMPVFNKAAKVIYEDSGNIVFTPLAAATFPTGALDEVARQLNRSPSDTIGVINSSTCSGGHLLEDSDGAIAVVAALSAVQGKSPELAKSVVSKIVKQYSASNKLSASKLNSLSGIAQFASGGVPVGFEFEKLEEMFKIGREKAVNLRELLSVQPKPVTVQKFVVDEPGASGGQV